MKEIEEINLASVGVDIAIEKLKTKFKELGFSSFENAVKYIISYLLRFII